ncbi:hypothetical protein OAV85_00760 [Candidatus Nanopelagicales bacterium]|nr:hypothetical protein [Candidatus Nanopelagicales bacterium]
MRFTNRYAIRTAIAAIAAIGLTLGTTGTASAASNEFIATPNGMVGMQQEIVFRAPSLAGQVATIGFTSGAISNAGQTAVNSQGFGSMAWTPTSAGSWTISGLGNAAGIGSTTINVAPMPTGTYALVPNTVQTGVENRISVVVNALDGIIAPSGTVTLRNQNQNVIGTGTLSPNSGTTSTASVAWTPAFGDTVTASYTPATTAFLTSTADTARPGFTTSVVTVALRFPPVLYVGTPTILGAQTGTGIPVGSASFFFDGIGIIGSTPTNSTGGVAATWTPTASGVHTISTEFSSGNGQFSGTSSQVVNIQPAQASDSVTVTPAGSAAWNPGLPITLASGSNTALTATAASGATVVLSETGPCVINGSTLTALSAGQCTVSATSPGSTAVGPVTTNYTITIQAPANKKKKKR